MSANKIQHKVNHVALVVDCSGSMHPHQSQLIRVVDEFVAGLKAESDSLGHETRISLYSFDHKVENLVWDMDVKHLPSMRGLYQVNNGATALIEASLKSLDDLGHIWEEYGEHSFLQIVVTDGEENASGGDRRHDGDMAILGPWLDRITAKMGGLPGHWTSAILVPNSLAKRTAQNYGFPAGNIAIWDADSQKGVEEAIGTVRAAATSFLRGREHGVRGTKNLFAVGQDISVDEVRANLEPIPADKYRLLKVDKEVEIRPFVNSHPGVTYERGSCYYQLGVRAQVQQDKEVIVVEKDTDRAYTGDAARSLLFGTDVQGTLSVKAGNNPKLEVYVQSRSVNRKLKPNTRLLIML
ncbi:VWA domain-containing protein [Streptomyces sp. uw30]|uniref:vWA domain-containing protein n=1 Tax=Streptomyces sp. uw30 TaxID=1828179 RepID=UPI0011CEA216|nr:vWA domain-containing protein [Streptomyces sp. uw30]TXS44073.1 VWA domain-containing protein [Streptomyces sp. uw30]